jgi:hypothetical protein
MVYEKKSSGRPGIQRYKYAATPDKMSKRYSWEILDRGLNLGDARKLKKSIEQTLDRK